jgi:hypothetical protein
MNIEVKDSNSKLVEKICKETEMNPSQIMENLMYIMQQLYSDYERQKNAGVEKRPFKEIITNPFLDSFKSKLRTLNIAERLIESTNELLQIKDYIDAGIYNIDPDFDRRSISYIIGYEFCMESANMDAYKGLLIEVEINQDYIEVSNVVYLPLFESIKVTDKKVNDTSILVQDFIRDIHREEFSPFVNIEIKIFPEDSPLGPISETRQIIGIKLIVKADKASYMPSIEKVGLIIREVHALVIKKLAVKQDDHN